MERSSSDALLWICSLSVLGSILEFSAMICAVSFADAAVVPIKVTISSTTYNLFPGDEIPSGATVKAGGDFELGTVYIERSDVLYKVVTVLPPYMSAFEVGTSFFNARALNENHYHTFGHNPLEYLKGKPFITAFKA